MGDKKEDEHTLIPMPVQELYYQSPPPPENPNSEIVLDKSSRLTPSGGAPSTNEPRLPSGDASQPEADKSKDKKWTVECFWDWVIIVLFLPWYLLYALVAKFYCNTDVLEYASPEVRELKGLSFRVTKMVAAILSLVLTGLLTWLVINLSVKSLKRKIILGSHLWQWTLAVVILSFGYPTINMVTSLILHFFKKMSKHQKDADYFAEGLKTSFNLVIFSAALLLIWHFYFRFGLGLRNTSDTNLLFRMVKWTLVSLFIFSVCRLFKKTLLLIWEAHSTYYRFRERIVRARFQLCFLALISDTYSDIFTTKNMMEKEESNGTEKQKDEKEKVAPTVSADQGEKKLERTGPIDQTKGNVNQDEKKLERTGPFDQTKGNVNVDEERKTKERAAQVSKGGVKDMIGDLVKRTWSQPTTYEIQEMARYFINLAKLPRRMDDDISDILSKRHAEFPDVKTVKYITKEDLQKLVLIEEWAELFYEELKQKSHPGQVSFEALENWMLTARKTCLALGYTLAYANDAVNCLNRIMSGFIIAVVLFIWLLLTKIATTEVLVLIASQFIAAGFIFGESCKALLEGIVFQFVRHPFNVGDRCLIADKDTEMEVKRMGVLATTFLKIGSKEEVIYPNSMLTSTPIVNLGEGPDPADSVEFSVDKNTEKKQILDLDKMIKEYVLLSFIFLP
ncbi:hypothetical protein Ancab_012478 [Ancistrocladus abbreviatus]